MKTKGKISKILTAILIVASFTLTLTTINNCDPGSNNTCDPANYNDTAWYNIPPEDTVQIIYHGYEKLKFQVTIDSQVVDTVEFKGNGKIRSYWVDRDYGDCKHDRYEIQTITYKNTNKNSKWGDIVFEIEEHITYGSKFDVIFRNKEFNGSIGKLIYTDLLVDSLNYYSSITFNSIEYKKVILFLEDWKSYTGLTNDDPILYYVKREGIIRIKISANEYWDIIL